MSKLKVFEKGKAPDKNVYYVCLSAVQKCIRRCDATRAINLAKIAWRCEPFYFWRRMWVFLAEDCSRNVDALQLFYNWRTGPYDFEGMVPLIRCMADGPKDKVGPPLAAFLTHRYCSPMQVYLHLKDDPIHIILTELMKKWPDRGLSAYDKYKFVVGENDYSWLLELAERAEQYDRDKFCYAIPYFFMPETQRESIPPANEVSELILWNNCFPLEALDMHTRPGQAAYGTYRKRNSTYIVPNDDKTGFGHWIFWNEGGAMRNRHAYPYDFTRLWLSGVPTQTKNRVASDYISSANRELLFSEVLPEINKIRLWVIEKLYKDDFLRIQVEYQRDFVE